MKNSLRREKHKVDYTSNSSNYSVSFFPEEMLAILSKTDETRKRTNLPPFFSADKSDPVPCKLKKDTERLQLSRIC